MAYKQIEQNIIDSFRMAKRDIIAMQEQIIELSKKQEELTQELMNLSGKESSLYNKVSKIKNKPQRTIKEIVEKRIPCKTHTKFVASKTGKKFHIPACPFAKNIHPKMQIVFKSKTAALNKGLKPCNCAKK